MSEEKTKVKKIIEEVADDVCKNYCKYRYEATGEVDCPHYAECPLARLG